MLVPGATLRIMNARAKVLCLIRLLMSQTQILELALSGGLLTSPSINARIAAISQFLGFLCAPHSFSLPHKKKHQPMRS
jgi:hypothetical protein